MATLGATLTTTILQHSAAVPPTTGDDANDGYTFGTVWVDTATDRVYICVDTTVAAAIWLDMANPTTNFGKTVLSFVLNQGAAGTTQIAAASPSNKHKVVGAVVTLSADGTIKFTDGVGDLTGPMDVAAKSGFVIPDNILVALETSIVNTTLSIVTTGGAARGIIRYLTEP